MSTDNSTDDGRLHARIDAILTAAFPLAASPDFPIGPLPLFKIRNLLVEAYRTGLADTEPTIADIVRETNTEDALWRIDALLNATSAMIRDRDFAFDDESCLRLLIMAQSIVHKLLPEPGGCDE